MNRTYSNLASDPEFQDILCLFVSEIPLRIEKLRLALQLGDRMELQRLVHQLKGACGGYGFPSISQEAHQLESIVVDVENSSLMASVEQFIVSLSNLSAEKQ